MMMMMMIETEWKERVETKQQHQRTTREVVVSNAFVCVFQKDTRTDVQTSSHSCYRYRNVIAGMEQALALFSL
jgi:hypothetical protein